MDDLVSPLRAVSVLDPAIDWQTSDMVGYFEKRDLDLVQTKPGMSLMVAVLRPLTVGEFTQLDALQADGAKHLQAFRLACTSVENAQGPGLSLVPTTTVRMGPTERLVWGDEELAVLARKGGMRFVAELGRVAFERALLGNDWGGGACYTPPPYSVEGLGRKRHHPVEQSPASAGTSSSDKSSDDSTQTPAASSDAAGGASAASGETAPGAP